MSLPRQRGHISERIVAPAPDVQRYDFRRDMVRRHQRGTAVAYSTDGGHEHYAPFRGSPGCISRTGFERRAHEFDRDGVCLFCNELA